MADSIVNAEAKLAASARLMSDVARRLALASELLEGDSNGEKVPGALALIRVSGAVLDRGSQSLGELGYSTPDEWMLSPREIAALEAIGA